MAHYQKPDAVTACVINPLILALTKLGLSVRGAHVLAVRGRCGGAAGRPPARTDPGD